MVPREAIMNTTICSAGEQSQHDRNSSACRTSSKESRTWVGSAVDAFIGCLTARARGTKSSAPSGKDLEQNPTAPAKSFSSTMDALELQMWRTRQEAFWKLVSRLVQLNDVSLIVCAVLDHLEEFFQCASCALFLMDSNQSKMCRISKRAMLDEEVSFLADIPRISGLVAESIQNGMSVQLIDFELSQAYDASVDLPQDFPGQSLVTAALSANGLMYAAIQLTSRKSILTGRDDGLQAVENNWKGWEMELLSWLGSILDSCIRRTIEFQDISLSERTQNALLHISSSSDTEGTILDLIEGVISGASHITKAERISLYMIDWEARQLWTLASSHHGDNIRVSLDNSILGSTATAMKIININDQDKYDRFSKYDDSCSGIDVHGALYVPIGIHESVRSFDKEEILGVLEILNKDGGEEFTLDDEYAFEAFACEVAVILRRKRSEIDCIKLLTGTQHGKKLTRRRRSQIDLLECFTSYPSTLRRKMTDHVRQSFMEVRSASCGAEDLDGTDDDLQSKNSIDHYFEEESPRQQEGSTCDSCTGQNRSIKTIPGWEFNVFTVEADHLLDYAHHMCMALGMDKKLRIDSDTIWNFIHAVKKHYHPNPYHNFLHAVGVLHATYMILTTTQATNLLTSLDIVGCLIAALCHDIDHPGHSNAYEVMAGTQLAMLYSDESVLEYHHAYTTFRLLTKVDEINVLKNLNPTEYRYIRKVIINAILGTDMANHFNLCEKLDKLLHPNSGRKSSFTQHTQREPPLKSRSSCSSMVISRVEASKKAFVQADLNIVASKTNRIDRNHSTQIINAIRVAVYQTDFSKSRTIPEGLETKVPNRASTPPQPSMAETGSRQAEASSSLDERIFPRRFPQGNSLDDRLFLIKTIVHASDLSGQIYTKPVALKWSNLIAKEFANQALMETAENMPVSYIHLDDPMEMVEGQLFFLQKLVSPLWLLMQQIFPELEVCNMNLSQNLSHYEHELKRLRSCKNQSPSSSQSKEVRSDAEPIRTESTSMFTDKSAAKVDDIQCPIEDFGKEMMNDKAMNDALSITTLDVRASHINTGTEGLAVAGVVKSTPARFNSFLLPHQLTDLQASGCCLTNMSRDVDKMDQNWTSPNSMRTEGSEEILHHKMLECDARSRLNSSFSSRSSISSISEGSVEEISERDIESI
ncbi:unnamed protein product [Albugo candida]|uniref:Phosphodiesterase n=1 Tax=Albugo candida TaxID=65357 RepID=A0A024G2N7_9STRA|nr:unnamed protein product [Albugo candida]|eukprot:CCI40817.1 unnamed protein product [Albugo candida]